jgi:CheY-like chemotaxis protein
MPRRVLYIENDKALTESLQECIREERARLSQKVEIELVVARHMEEAVQLLDPSKPGFDALLLDLMLPRNAEDLADLEKLEGQRRKLVREYFRRANPRQPEVADEETVSLQKQIDMLDLDIEPRVAAEGGCEILEWLARKRDASAPPGRDPRPLEFPVVVFTARGLPEVKARCEKLVSERYYRFFDKPAMEADVLQALLDLLAASAASQE